MPIIGTTISNCLHNKAFAKLIIYSIVLLAATAQNKCTSLVWSCYVPSKGFNNKGFDRQKSHNNTDTDTLCEAENRYGLVEEVDTKNGFIIINKSSTSESKIEPFNLKSNLKKTVVLNEIHDSICEKRKVSWSDAHGKDIAHIQEFEPSVSEDGELEGVTNSCICVVQ